MSFVMKTGGIILLEDHSAGFECDLHVQGKTLIAVVTPPMQYQVSPEHERVQAIIPGGTDYFLWEKSKPYGTLVVPMNKVIATNRLIKHCQVYYPRGSGGYDFRFANWSTG
jgi:hypothetical protein